METKGHKIKLEKYDIDFFMIPIVVSRKKDGSIKMALVSKLLNDQILKINTKCPKYMNN